MRVLVTGAAGFIGSAVASRMRSDGHEVVGLDALIAQAHVSADEARRAAGLVGIHLVDLRDGASLRPFLEGVDVVCHQAAMVGAGVAASDLPLFAGYNDFSTAVLLAGMADAQVATLVLASSMVVYGDGRYRCPEHGEQLPSTRRIRDLEAGRFDPRCTLCARDLTWTLVDEDACVSPRSGYAASKVAQEHYASAWARQTGSRVVALRYHNVYGPGMPRDTPYSGVAALFRSALERNEAPRVFEDGRQMRDLVHVRDVANANVLALYYAVAADGDTFAAYNVCSGRPISILDVARGVATAADSAAPVVTGEFRPGDVRHIVASPARAERDLGFRAQVSPTEGLARFATDSLRST